MAPFLTPKSAKEALRSASKSVWSSQNHHNRINSFAKLRIASCNIIQLDKLIYNKEIGGLVHIFDIFTMQKIFLHVQILPKSIYAHTYASFQLFIIILESISTFHHYLSWHTSNQQPEFRNLSDISSLENFNNYEYHNTH